MFPNLFPKKDGMIGKTLRKQLHRSVQNLVFGKTLLRKEGAEFAKPGEVGEYLSRSNTGLLLDGKDLRLSEQVSFQNVAVYGITGKGKSTAIARPAILDKASSDAVMIVNDMSGDLYRDTSGYMQARGYRVIVLNPNDLTQSNRFNPFLSLKSPAAIMRMAELFSKTGGDGDDKFWASGAERYIRFFLKCLGTMPDVFNTPHNLYHLLSNFGTDGEDLDEWVASCAKDDVFLQNEWKALTTGADETITSFLTNALVGLKIFSEPHVCALTARSDFDLSTLRTEKTIVYIVTPPEDQAIYRPVISMYFLSLVHACMKQLPGPQDLPVYLIYDEFGNSFLPGFDTLITTTRKYRMSFLLLMQGQQQLITKYGKDLMHVIMSGIATQISFGAAEHVTASFFEQKAGRVRMFYRNEERETHIEHQNEYNLINASEIRELPDDKLLIISDNRKTTLIDVYPSHKSARWLRMMKLPPALIISPAQDRLVFIPL
jgi:type IV secretory pathway TraG/TraD family ATPase VirD4